MFKSLYIAIILTLYLISNLSAQMTFDTNIIVGAERIPSYIESLKGKNIGVVANHTTFVADRHLVDTLLSLDINIAKIYSPEHGFRGKASAGEKVSSEIDVKTGIPIVSLYGSNKKPNQDQLSGIDLIIFDIQDVGARFYTYISTMHYVMEACAEKKIPFLVLDRPNPNGHYVDGPILKEENKSFVGMHPVPIVHGMTIGEYAQMINEEGWLDNSMKVDLTVVSCENYDHTKFYEVPIAPSPNLPNMTAIYLYPSLCLFEGTNVSVGRGTDFPFQIIGSPFIPVTEFSFIPKKSESAKWALHADKKCNGYNLISFGNNLMRDVKGLYLFWLEGMYAKTVEKNDFFLKNGFFHKLSGDKKLMEYIKSGKSIKEIKDSWFQEISEFKSVRSKYLLYKDFE